MSRSSVHICGSRVDGVTDIGEKVGNSAMHRQTTATGQWDRAREIQCRQAFRTRPGDRAATVVASLAVLIKNAMYRVAPSTHT
jgi:hypothetical protein